MTKKKSNFAVLIFFISTILTGCQQASSNNSTWALLKTIDPEPLLISQKNSAEDKQIVEEVREETSSIPSIYDVAVIKGEKDTLVAYKVKHMYRLKMKKIESELKGKLEERFPDQRFTVSSDFKIFLETIRLWDKMQDANYSEKQANKQLEEIIKLNNELT
jgi:hypothetical protein